MSDTLAPSDHSSKQTSPGCPPPVPLVLLPPLFRRESVKNGMLAVELAAKQDPVCSRPTFRGIKSIVTTNDGRTRAYLISSHARLALPPAVQRLAILPRMAGPTSSQSGGDRSAPLASVSADVKMPISTVIKQDDDVVHMIFSESTRLLPSSVICNADPEQKSTPTAPADISQSALLLAPPPPHILDETHRENHGEAAAPMLSMSV